MANDDCLPQVQACAVRVTDLDSDGSPLVGDDTMYVSDALVSLEVTPVYVDGTEIEEKTACDRVAVNFVGDDSLKRLDIALVIATQDPYLVEKLGGGSVVTDAGINGYRFPGIGALSGDGVSIELWAKRVDDGVLHPDWPYAWHVLPLVKNLRHGVRTFSNGAQLPAFSGRAYMNSNWLDGPENDFPVATDDTPWIWFPTPTLPEASCGPLEVVAS